MRRGNGGTEAVRGRMMVALGRFQKWESDIALCRPVTKGRIRQGPSDGTAAGSGPAAIGPLAVTVELGSDGLLRAARGPLEVLPSSMCDAG